MPIILAYDSETTDLPVYHSPSDGKDQPHIVELGAVLFDTDRRAVIDDLDTLIIPNGWQSSPEALATHGITEERAKREGIPERVALALFLDLWRLADFRVAHNEAGFDRRIIRIAIKRYGDGTYGGWNWSQERRDALADEWRDAPGYCTMYGSRRERPAVFRQVPKLGAACEYWTGKPQLGAHSAMADADTCLDVFLAMLDAGCDIDPRGK